jgi:hypothetical protein
MIRLQRVTFLALHDYLGLTTELTRSNDDTAQVQTTDRTRNNHHRQQSQTLPKVTHHATTTSIDTLNNPEDDSVEDENALLSRSISTVSYTSPSADHTQTTTTPEITENDNQFKAIQVPIINERTGSIPTPVPKRSAAFAGHRSMSVVESRHMKPDFEEAAARARVKNSLDTTFFEKHKISYPNVSTNRANQSAARRRSSYSDVKLPFILSFS